MAIDPRLLALGYSPVGSAQAGKKRRLFITMEGLPSTGKTDFLRRCPPPQVCIDFDRGMEGVCEHDIWGNEIMRRVIEMPDLDVGGKFATDAERTVAKNSYEQFKRLTTETFKALSSIGGGTLSIETGGAAYSLAQIARFGQIAQLGEVPAAMWTSMQAEFQQIFLQYEDYPVNLIVSHRQGSKFGGAAGETDLKGYKEMKHLSQIHLEFLRVYRRTAVGMVERDKRGTELFDLVRKVGKCRARLSLLGAEFPVVFVDDEMRDSVGGDFETIALAVFPETSREDWF